MRMDAVHIEGGRKLQGEVRLSGAKNAALPMLAAACLGEEATMLDNVPVQLNDVILQIELLRAMGAEIEVEGDSVRCARGALGSRRDAPAELACKIRYSLLLLGMYAALRSELFLPQPGGCQIGDRKYDLHLLGLRKLGAHVEEQAEGVYVKAGRLRGEAIDFYLPTTSGTENVMLAAAVAEGTTTLRNANTRPEVMALGDLLNAMGARVQVQSRIVTVEGVQALRGGARLAVMPGWDEAVSYIAAAGMTGGEIAIHNFDLKPIREDARYLREAGLGLFEWQGSLYVSGRGAKNPIDLFTAPYPGVNSDMQPIFAALALTLPGVSTIT
ncbi:MAG: UDP-N-acetylglucosamine 1-carboxyvinyltransferase, partial [Chloroflexi bacterium]|nr:UDP-N-acetylglucosamine 1-carboxyvinyltransferase [Chloroflexota bacterium]